MRRGTFFFYFYTKNPATIYAKGRRELNLIMNIESKIKKKKGKK